ncbi:hypothetical protein [Prosthecomicrobium sp. N25]|uniref:hypothetical protein n=1 Tax=Prosthecomicrobium sp. N25 TaxID=3129254 RepID=UPI0030773141
MSLRRSILYGFFFIVLAIGAAVAYRGVSAQTEADRARLSGMAGEAAPIIAVLDRVRKERGALPHGAEDLAGLLPEGVLAEEIGYILRFDTGTAPGWLFVAAPGGHGYELSRRLGEEARLLYQDEDGKGRWLWDPGDGTGPAPVDLDP